MNKETIIKKLEEKSKVIMFSAVGVIILATAIIGIFASKKPSYNYFQAKRTDIAQSVSMTGEVKSSQDLSLSFKKGGSVASIKVSTGDEVTKGQPLISLDGKDASAAVSQANAALDAAEAAYEKLQNGATQSQIDVAKSAVDSAQVALDNANNVASKNISSQYSAAKTALDDSYIKMYNAYSTVDTIQNNYFSGNDQEGLSVRYNKDYGITAPKNSAKTAIDAEKASGSNDDIDKAISQTANSLNKILDALSSIRSTCDSTSYQTRVSAADKAALDTQKGYISASLTTISQLQNSIAVLKTQSASSINSAEAALSQAKANLSLTQSPARQEDIDTAKANVEASEATLEVAQNAYADTIIKSPIDGVVTNISPKIGEVVAAGTPAISLISQGKFQIETYISETDLGKIQVGAREKITLDAYGSQTSFDASVISINPAATISNGIPTYKVISQFDNQDDKIKTGMTANVTILGEKHRNALVVPTSSIIGRGNDDFVLIYKNGKTQEKQVSIGIQSNDGYTEILSGLNEGDKVASFGK